MSGRAKSVKRVSVPRGAARVLLSDVLPFEVPPNFSNARLYRFIRDNRVKTQDGNLEWRDGDPLVEKELRVLFEIPSAKLSLFNGHTRSLSIVNRSGELAYTVALGFEALRPNGELRVLSVPHPRSQVLVAEFYENHWSSILQHANNSPVSLRRPVRVARYTNVKDRLHRRLLRAWAVGSPEVEDREERTLRTYFVYRRHTNAFQFYDSRSFQELEQRYPATGKADVSKCFRSIYTHSIAWATHGKRYTKDNLGGRGGAMSFAEAFDHLVQKLNFNETAGLLVGPEFSRLFAEVILQAVDRDLLGQLKSIGYQFGRDFEIRRYVDDYFIFASRPQVREAVMAALSSSLLKFNLHLNDGKSESADGPSITPVSVAKLRIRQLMSDARVSSGSKTGGSKSRRAQNRSVALADPRTLITEYKVILGDSGAHPAALASYTLSACEKAIVRIVERYVRNVGRSKRRRLLLDEVSGLVDFAWFVYSTSPLLTSTVKIARIVDHCVTFAESGLLGEVEKRGLIDQLGSQLRPLLTAPLVGQRANIERLYLLHASARIGNQCLVEPRELELLFGLSRAPKDSGPLRFDTNPSYFDLVTLLAYCRKRTRYKEIRKATAKEAVELVRRESPLTTERLLMAVDFMSCPFVQGSERRAMAKAIGVSDSSLIAHYSSGKAVHFTEWRDFSLGKALDLKRSQEVY